MKNAEKIQLNGNGKTSDQITEAMTGNLWTLTFNYDLVQHNFGQMVFMYETTRNTLNHQPYFTFKMMVGVRDATTGQVKVRTHHTVKGKVEKHSYGDVFVYDETELIKMQREVDGLMRGYEMAIEALNSGIFSLR